CPACSNGYLKYSGQAGAKAEFSFYGTGVKWNTAKAPVLGKAKIYFDGAYKGMVDLYRSTVQYPLVLGGSGIPPGNHTLTIEVSGQKNASSTGYYTVIDAFEAIPAIRNAPATYLFYIAESTSNPSAGSGLYAVDPDNPGAQPYTIEASGIEEHSVSNVFYGNVDFINQVVSGAHGNHAVMYAKQGKIYRVDGLKGGSLVPYQISNEAGITSVCDTRIGQDFSDLNSSQYLYSQPGPDGNCWTDDDLWRMVRLGMSAVDTPIPAKEPVDIGWNQSNGSIIGWLVKDGGSLKRCDKNFASCTTVINFTNSAEEIGWSPLGLIPLAIDNKLYVYNFSNGTLSGALYTFSDPYPGWGEYDLSAFYIKDNEKILRLDWGNYSITQLVDEGAFNDIYDLRVTRNRIIYSVGNQSLKSIPKTGGSPIILAQVVTPGTYIDISDISYNGHVYYEIIGVAGHIKDDGTGKDEVQNAQWIGGVYPTDFSFDNMEGRDKVIRAECSLYSGCGNGTIRAFDASTYSNPLIMGTLPGDISSVWFGGYGSHLLVEGWPSAGSISDVLYLNTGTANSLRRITNTTDISEYPAF
ncbi:MAG TPA: hypothetical protein VFF47_05150, partial [Nitrospirota bacterium]|nr:hypothetical protein [Nitrospirota bacterium]